MHTQLHWLDIPDHVSYKIMSMVYRCTVYMARLCSTCWPAVSTPGTDYTINAISALPGTICSPFSVIGSASALTAATFSVTASATWNSLRDPALRFNYFRQQ